MSSETIESGTIQKWGETPPKWDLKNFPAIRSWFHRSTARHGVQYMIYSSKVLMGKVWVDAKAEFNRIPVRKAECAFGKTIQFFRRFLGKQNGLDDV